MKQKLHIERPMEVLFGIGPALCGKRKPVDYRMFPPDDEMWRRAQAKFFATRARDATCVTCKLIAKAWNR